MTKAEACRGPFPKTIDGHIARCMAYLEWFDSDERQRVCSQRSDDVTRAKVAAELATLRQVKAGVSRTLRAAIRRRALVDHQNAVRYAECNGEVQALEGLRQDGLLFGTGFNDECTG